VSGSTSISPFALDPPYTRQQFIREGTESSKNVPRLLLYTAVVYRGGLKRGVVVGIEQEKMTSVCWCLKNAIPKSYNPRYPDEFWGIIDAIWQNDPNTWYEADDHFEEYLKVMENDYAWQDLMEEWEEKEPELREKWDKVLEYYNANL